MVLLYIRQCKSQKSLSLMSVRCLIPLTTLLLLWRYFLSTVTTLSIDVLLYSQRNNPQISHKQTAEDNWWGLLERNSKEVVNPHHQWLNIQSPSPSTVCVKYLRLIYPVTYYSYLYSKNSEHKMTITKIVIWQTFLTLLQNKKQNIF